MRVIELGKGTVKVTPCFVSMEDRRQALLLEPGQEPHEIGILTGDPDGPFVPQAKDTMIIFGSVEAGEVLLEQVRRCIEEMRSNAEITGRTLAQNEADGA